MLSSFKRFSEIIVLSPHAKSQLVFALGNKLNVAACPFFDEISNAMVVVVPVYYVCQFLLLPIVNEGGSSKASIRLQGPVSGKSR